MRTGVKICGLTTAEAVEAAIGAGAAYVGFVFHPASPRAVGLDQARALMERARGRARTVALVVDAPPDLLDRIARDLAPDLLQFHGAEPPQAVAAARADYGRPVIKALGVREAADLEAVADHEAAADHLLLDARPPAGASRPGGHGAAFDWRLLDGARFARPWFLAGGLNPDNVAEAVRRTAAPLVDVSSGVERAPGVKDPILIRAFLDAVKAVPRQ